MNWPVTTLLFEDATLRLTMRQQEGTRTQYTAMFKRGECEWQYLRLYRLLGHADIYAHVSYGNADTMVMWWGDVT
jgi:hypothetical protein